MSPQLFVIWSRYGDMPWQLAYAGTSFTDSVTHANVLRKEGHDVAERLYLMDTHWIHGEK